LIYNHYHINLIPLTSLIIPFCPSLPHSVPFCATLSHSIPFCPSHLLLNGNLAYACPSVFKPVILTCPSTAGTESQSSWSCWNPWSECSSQTCGSGAGVRRRTRACVPGTDPAQPVSCSGKDQQEDPACAQAPCPGPNTIKLFAALNYNFL